MTEGTALTESAAELPWTEFLGAFQPEVSEFLAKYRRLVEARNRRRGTGDS